MLAAFINRYLYNDDKNNDYKCNRNKYNDYKSNDYKNNDYKSNDYFCYDLPPTIAVSQWHNAKTQPNPSQNLPNHFC
ncbi:MAG: hypothetical protein DHS20C18_13630 [Saprospiraceae bacterium]|nr:MAG: hypothetical protein DHS20C18_13630 [Saprospiraceae bacterium]